MTDKQEIDAAVERIMDAVGRCLEASAGRREEMYSLRSLVRAELEARVPQGWQVVLVEPTEEMAKRFCANPDASFAVNYRAMLAAAPTPQQEKP